LDATSVPKYISLPLMI